MAQQVGAIYYTVEADTGRLLSAERDVSAATDRMGQGFDRTDKKAAKLSTGMNKLASAIKLVIAASAVREIAGLVQKYQEMAERVQMATAGQAEYEMVQKRLLATANGTYRSLEEAQELYIRTADSLRSMGYSTSQAVDVQDSMSYAFVRNATAADRAQAAISAFSKSVNTGKVAADQWETLTSAIPTVIDDIAAASGRSAAEVRALGAAGKLTAQELTEGLRKSLDENSAAAAKMTTNMVDAGVRMGTAIQSVLVGIESQTGVIQGLTDGIIMAADAMLSFSDDASGMASLLDAASIAGSALAAVIAGRIVMAVGSYTVAQATALRTTLARIQADQVAAQGALRRAAAEKAAAMQAVATATAEFNAARGTNAHALAADALTAARTRAATAAGAYAGAQAVANAAMSAGVGIATRLRMAMAFLGGPAGVFFLVATAAYHLVSSLRDTSKSMDGVIARVDAMRKSSGKGALDEIRQDADTLRTAISEAESAARRLYTAQAAEIPDSIYNKKLAQLKDYRERLADVEQAERDAMQLEKDRIALQKQMDAAGKTEPTLTGGGDTGADKDAEKAAKRALKERADLLKQNADAVADLQQKFALATLAGEDLAIANARLALNPAATPEQIAEVEALARAMWRLEEAERAREMLMRADPFEAEKARYQQQITEYQQLNEMKLLSDQRYLELKAQAQTAHDEQMRAMQEENLRRQSQGYDILFGALGRLETASADALTGLITGATSGQEVMQQLGNAILRDAVGALTKMGIEYVRNAVLRQAMASTEMAAIASTTAAQAAATATTTATTVAAAGTITAAAAPAAGMMSIATMGKAALIGGAALAATMAIAKSFGGGRQYGGPVDASKMYRINENGRPEVFQAANGQQYMLPNTRGEVVSNADAGSAPQVVVPVTIHNYSSSVSVQRQDVTQADGQRGVAILIQDLNSDGKVSKALQSTFGLTRRGR